MRVVETAATTPSALEHRPSSAIPQHRHCQTRAHLPRRPSAQTKRRAPSCRACAQMPLFCRFFPRLYDLEPTVSRQLRAGDHIPVHAKFPSQGNRSLRPRWVPTGCIGQHAASPLETRESFNLGPFCHFVPRRAHDPSRMPRRSMAQRHMICNSHPKALRSA